MIDTCFATHHLQFAFDDDNTLWTSAGGPQNAVVGWLNTKKFLATGDAAASQGWTALVLDTNGNGKRDDYVVPNQPVDPQKDKRIVAALYGIAVSPADGSIWGTTLGFPGAVVHLPGANPPETALAEYYEVPWDDPKAPVHGYSPRGMDVDKNGVVWVPLANGHFASFDRKKCEGPLNGHRRPASNAPRVGRSTHSPGRSCRTMPGRAAPRRATTPGSTSSTRLASEPTYQSLPATVRRVCSLSSTASS